MSTKEFYLAKKTKREIVWILKWFLIWRIFLQAVLEFISVRFPIQENFLGGKDLYFEKPWFWAWGNYDAIHYMSIVRNGYRPLQYFYFPLYPLVVNKLSRFASAVDLEQFLKIGLVVSHVSFFLALVGLYKLLKLKFSDNTAKLSILILLFFPTSYYFAAGYTESLFLTLVVWSFYFYEKGFYFKSGVTGALASAARSTGILLFAAIVIDYFFVLQKKGELSVKKLLAAKYIFLIPLGLISYMYYLYVTTGNAFAFNESGYIFGEYRSATPVFLPRVFYRYIFKIIPNLNFSYFPGTFTILFEFISAVLLSVAALFGLGKIRPGWWVYMVGGFVIPTLYLNFVSLPRYTIVLFPFFLLTARFLEKRSKTYKAVYFLVSCIGLVVALSLFSRGYWLS